MKRFIEKRKKFIRDEQGAVAILCAVIMVILLGFAALAIDYGLVYYRDSQLQNAVDIAARAASRTLVNVIDDDTLTDDEKEARCNQTAEYYMKENGFPQSVLTKFDVEYDKCNGSVTIDARSKVDLNFARVFGQQNIPIAAGTTAQTDVHLEGGYEYIVDVVFVIDLSGSMYMSQIQNKMVPLGKALNRTIDTILSENPQNRVGIVVYSDPDESRVLMPLQKKEDITTYTYGDKIMYMDYEGKGADRRKLANGNGQMDASLKDLSDEGTPIYFAWVRADFDSDSETFGNYREYMHVVADGYEYHNRRGATDTQRGIYQAAEALRTSYDDGISRNPVIFVFTDGEATWGDVQYWEPSDEWYIKNNNDEDRDSHEIENGDGGANGVNANVGKYTIMTAKWAKDTIQAEYLRRNDEDFPTQSQIFTLGFKLDSVTHKSVATYVLNPEACLEPTGYEAGENGNDYVRSTREELQSFLMGHPELYYNDEYYDASNQQELDDMMNNFATTVVAPTKYFKTYLTK